MIHGIKVVYGKRGRFVAMPSDRWKNQNDEVRFNISFIGFDLAKLPTMLIGFIQTATMLILCTAVLGTKALGGADIKLAAVCSFMLGLKSGIIALIIGLLLFLIVIPICRKINGGSSKNSGESYPLVPFLSVGVLAAALI